MLPPPRPQTCPRDPGLMPQVHRRRTWVVKTRLRTVILGKTEEREPGKRRGEGRGDQGGEEGKKRERERMASRESWTEHSVPAHPPNQFHFFLSNKTVGRTRSWLTGTREAAQPPGAQRPFLRLCATASGTLQAPSHPKGPPVAVRASSCTGVSVCFRKENRPFTQPYPRRRPRSRGDDPTPVPRGRGRLGRGGHKYLCSSLCSPDPWLETGGIRVEPVTSNLFERFLQISYYKYR